MNCCVTTVDPPDLGQVTSLGRDLRVDGARVAVPWGEASSAPLAPPMMAVMDMGIVPLAQVHAVDDPPVS